MNHPRHTRATGLLALSVGLPTVAWLVLAGPACAEATAGASPRSHAVSGAAGGLRFEADTFYYSTLHSTSAGDDASYYNFLHRPSYGGFMSGVSKLSLTTTQGSRMCSGALLGSGKHVLTAAHCVTGSSGQKVATGGKALFPTTLTGVYTGQTTALGIKHVKVHAGYDGDFIHTGNDLAVITLEQRAPKSAKRYQLYTDHDEIGKVSTKAGWGGVGTGNGRFVEYGFRKGENVYDATATTMLESLGSKALDSVLQYDFDNGKARNDAFGFFFELDDLGLGLPEVSAGPGDSGGPTFIDGMLAGITSYGITLRNDTGSTSDVTPGRLDSSFGEFGGDTRVSYHADWINAALVPEPGTWALLVAGLGALAAAARRSERT